MTVTLLAMICAICSYSSVVNLLSHETRCCMHIEHHSEMIHLTRCDTKSIIIAGVKTLSMP